MGKNWQPSGKSGDRMYTGGRWVRCDRNIFWNTYSQECSFRDIYPPPPSYVQTTCVRLWEKYPDYEEAELFIRAQFAMSVVEMTYHTPGVVHQFSHLIRVEHDDTFVRYREERKGRALRVLESIRVEMQEGQEPLPLSLLTRFVIEGADSPLNDRMWVLVECLRWPELADILPLTPEMREQLQVFRTEIRRDEYSGKKWLRAGTWEHET